MTVRKKAMTADPSVTLDVKTMALLLKNAAVTASNDDARPILECAHVEITKTELIVTTTDSYSLLEQRLKFGGGDEFSPGTFLVELPTFLPFLPLLKWKDTATLKQSGGQVVLSTDGRYLSAKAISTEDGPSYPKTQPLFEKASRAGFSLAAFNATFLARMAKVDLGCGKHMSLPWTARSCAPEQPSRWTAKYESLSFTFLLMPVRTDETEALKRGAA